MNNTTLISICCATYNHDKYISKTIEGFLIQETDFQIEIIIHDDASKDNTQEILKEYAIKDSRINLVLQKENQMSKGLNPTIDDCLLKAKGKYIALCDGDDYWTDPFKLQKQVDFLELNPNFQVCFTNTSVVNGDNKIIKDYNVTKLNKDVFEHKDMPVYAPTLTRVFRKIIFPESIKKSPSGDNFMLVYQSKFGKIKFLDEVTAAYRQHDKGVWSGVSKAKQISTSMKTSIACLEILEDYMFPKYFGMLLGSLLKLKTIDKTVFKEMTILVNQKLKEYKGKISLKNYLTIRRVLILNNSNLVNYHTIRTHLKSTIKTLKTSV